MSGLRVLDEGRAQTFRQALTNILSTEIAESTYAQILDGLPTKQSIIDCCGNSVFDHPVWEMEHQDICEGYLEKARRLRSQFDLSTLRFTRDVGVLPLPPPTG